MARVRVRLDDAGEGNLPHVCMYCGEETDETVLKTLKWQPQWLGVVLLVGLFLCFVPALVVYIIVGLAFTNKAVVKAPLCEDHQGHWTNRILLIIGSFFVFVVVAGLLNYMVLQTARPGGADFTPVATIGTLLLFVAWIVTAVVAQNTTIQLEEITDRELIIKGVCDQFRFAVDEVERKRRARLEQAAADDELLTTPRPAKKKLTDSIQSNPKLPKRKAPPSDAIEE
jgi:hypothetical protein